jgi:hypothetical protein
MITRRRAILSSIAAASPSLASIREITYQDGNLRLQVTLESIEDVLRSDTEILNFPGYIEFEGMILLTHGRGQHNLKDDRRTAAISRDGKTWQLAEPGSPYLDNLQNSGIWGKMRDGSWLYIDPYPDKFPAETKKFLESISPNPSHAKIRLTNPRWRTRRFAKTGELAETWTATVTNLPWEEASYENYGSILDLPNGDLYTAFQVILQPPPPLSSSVFFARSKDRGKTWQYIQTITPSLVKEKLEQGFCEPDTVHLANGDLLCILRTGSFGSLYQVRSTDGGNTWSAPEKLGWPGVKPKLRLLSNGVLAMSTGRGHYGRPQVTCAMFSIDGTGRVWEPPMNFHVGPGCSYAWNTEKKGRFCVIYSHSDFWHPLGTNNLPYQAIKMARFRVEKS